MKGEEEQGRRNKRGPSASTHEEQRATRGRGLFLSLFGGRARMWSKNRDFGWKRQKRRFGPDGCRRGEEGGLSIHLCPGVQKDVGPIFRPCLLTSLPPKRSKPRVRLAEAFTRRKERKTLGEFSPPPPLFFSPNLPPCPFGRERKSKRMEDRVNNLSEKLKKNCL